MKNTNKFKLIGQDDLPSETLDFKSYLKEISEIDELFIKNTGYDISPLKEYKNKFIFIDLTINKLLLFSKIIEWLESNNKKCIWIASDKQNKGNSEFEAISLNLANSIWVMKFLLSRGIDFQAKIIFRNVIELLDILIAIIGDQNFYNEYIKSVSIDCPFEDFKGKWYKLVRPKKIKNTTDKIYEEVLKDERFKVLMNYFKEKNYEWLSIFSHGSNTAIKIGNLVRDVEGGFVQNKYCTFDFKTSSTIDELIIHSGLSIIIIYKLITQLHNVQNVLSNKLTKELTDKNYIYEQIYYQNIVSLLES